MFNYFNFSANISFLVKVLIEMSVNISNEINFFNVFQSVNYIRLYCQSLHELLSGAFTLQATQCSLHFTTQCSLHFNKLQKIEIHS